MKYYIKNRHEQRQGPFDIEELRNIHITKDTLVWSKGLYQWTKANEVLELIDLVSETPVPYEKSIEYLLWKMEQEG